MNRSAATTSRSIGTAPPGPGWLLAARLLRFILGHLLQLNVVGLDHYRSHRGPLLVVANHTSFLDALLLALILPDHPPFVVNTHIASRWWLRPLLPLVGAFTMDPLNPISVKQLIHHLRGGGRAVIFPEGRITTSGTLMKIFPGPAVAADRSGADVMTAILHGLEFSHLSRMAGEWPLRLFPPTTLTFSTPKPLKVDPNLRGHKRRKAATQALEARLQCAHLLSADYRQTLDEAFRQSLRRFGGSRIVAIDHEQRQLSANGLLRRSAALGRAMARDGSHGEATGLLLPNSLALLVALFALFRHGRVAALLNFTSGQRALVDACRSARIDTVYTSRRFVEQAGLGDVVEGLSGTVRLVWLESLAEELTIGDKLAALTAGWLRPARSVSAENRAVILFTSGSEGRPKGVVLSHANLLANIQQVATLFDLRPRDRIFNPLPMFHAFGLTAGTLLPLLRGARVLLYPSPLHYRTIPGQIYDLGATVLFGTDTFLRGYARRADRADLLGLRLVIAGAEPLTERTAAIWQERFGIRILEGYGATECAPVISVNTPASHRSGSVGRPLPAIECRLEPVEGIANGGRLLVRGPNIMLGYLLPERAGELVPPPGGWYDTGDVVEIDPAGRLQIVGRLKRFAKIGGEMVSLASVELLARHCWPEQLHAAVAINDQRRGQRIVLVSEGAVLARQPLITAAAELGLAELAIPARLLSVERLPLLASGKIDYPQVEQLVINGKVGDR